MGDPECGKPVPQRHGVFDPLQLGLNSKLYGGLRCQAAEFCELVHQISRCVILNVKRHCANSVRAM